MITERKHTQEALAESEQRVRRKLENIIAPEDIADLDLADIIDAPALQALVDDFHQLTGMPMGLIDLKGQVLAGVGWQDVCTKFHRVNPDSYRNCLESDIQLSAGIPHGEYKVYKCRNNMWDVATPVMVGDRQLGNLFMGQFFFEDEQPDYGFFRAQAARFGFDEQAYIAALEAVPRLSRETLHTSMNFFMKLADNLSRQGYSNLKLARSLAERDALMASLREREQEKETAVVFLRLVNESQGSRELIRAATLFFQEYSGCEAVGIRLRDGDDYPYYETRGFTPEFVESENRLCDYDETGSAVRDDNGNPLIACMCGNVICRRFDPVKPFFTANGSFWSNSTSELLASTSEADRQSRTRNRCNGEGYESVALIPLRQGEERQGLLQLNDRRKGRFTPETIALWERLADYLAVALAKFRTEETLAAAKETLEIERDILQAIMNGAKNSHLIYLDRNFNFVHVNETYARTCGYRPEEMIGRNHFCLYPNAENEAIFACVRDSGEPVAFRDKPFEFPDQPERGVTYWDWTLTPIKDLSGQVAGLVFSLYETTELKRAGEEIRRRSEELRATNEELSRFNEASVGRELRMIELKKEINELCRQAGLPPRHQLDFEEGD
ncbi:PocR ligand-binding domain-containing protein [Geobacter pelophilus]|uniref:PocR ligand-binding domain-containing protein n=1 Tax=Geoanaerobacter pelophilus TaxID=60036 RepID=A0AAW4LA36_9BACT|nr:PocR ligand-binding domain-containing protein [Geoanaerobacter pelophilus]MBT0664046.1 PocR ligand-binding domain-containing protein [Geoanaerobacter pelophilus]